MGIGYPYPEYPFVRPPELDGRGEGHYPVIIIGAGPIGLALAIDLDRKGIRSLVIDEDNTVSVGSRAICWAKRTLEIFDRLGCGERMLAKGVTWNVGRIFFRDDPEPLYSFNLLPNERQYFPAFINLQQYYTEEYLVDAAAEHPLAELRWLSKVVDVQPGPEAVTVTVQTPAGEYRASADYVIACDGSRSPVRDMLGLSTQGETFQDHFLIADITMNADFPNERWYHFDPPYNRNFSTLLHKQPDNAWRIDFQLGWENIDRDEEIKEENVDRRLRAMLGEGVEWQYEWRSIYTFRCQRLERFVHDRVIFAGDAAHLVSPFGARGANSGIQDVDNLAWKLALVLAGKAPRALLETYHDERSLAADENIANSTRATDFITPKTRASRAIRDATLELAREHEFARRLVNSGRLSVPAVLEGSPLNTPDADSFEAAMRPGSPSADAPVRCGGADDWLLRRLGEAFHLLYFTGAGAQAPPAELAALAGEAVPVRPLVVGPPGSGADLEDVEGLVAERFDARPGTAYLLRPDQHCAGRWRRFEPAAVRAARDRACGLAGAAP